MPVVMGALGGAWVQDGDGNRQQPSSTMQATLLAVLLLNRDRNVSLDLLLDALWPGPLSDQDSNRKSLRVHMSNLRRWVRDVAGDEAASRFETRGDGYALMLSPTSFDVVTFENLLAKGQEGLLSNDSATAMTSLTSALAMWGEPYPELADHEPAEPERVRLTAVHDLAQDERIEAQIRQGNFAEVIGQLEARLVDHPFRERSYGQLMRALYRTGRQADALATFQRARACLLDELGLEPGLELRTLEQQILTQTLAAAPTAVAASQQPRSQFVGRDGELQQAIRALRRGDNIVVSGEAGIGKTRLIHELADSVATRRWIWTRSSQDRATPPLWPLLNALGLTTDENEATDAASEFERNHRVIGLLTSGEPTVLVLDDFHWADEATVRFVRQLVEYETDALATLIATRSAAIHMESEAGQTVLELNRRETTLRLNLHALDVAATRALVGNDPLSEDLVQQLHARSAGNPLFLTELLSAGPDIDTVTPAISNLVLGRLDRADRLATDVLATAAVIDDEANAHLIMRAGGFSAADVVAGIDSGRRMGLLVSNGSGQDMFAHSLIRDSLAASLSESDRCGIHDRIASEIESRIAVDEPSRYRLAHHSFQALPLGSAERATQASTDAGALAAKSFSFADARDHYQRAQAAAEYLDAPIRGPVMPSILCELGYYTIRAGDTATGRDLLMSAIDAAQLLDDEPCFIRSARCLVEATSPASTTDPRVGQIVERAVRLSEGQRTEDRVQLLVDLAGLRYFTHDIDHRRALCQKAMELAPHVGDRSLAIAATGTWTALYEPLVAHERLDVIAISKAAAQRSRSVDLAVLSASLEITTNFELARIEHAFAILDQIQVQAKALQAPRLMWFLQGWHVVRSALRGELDEAEALANEGLGMWEGGAHENSVVAYGGQLVMIRLLQNRGAEMIDLIRGMLAGEPDNPAFQAVLAFVLAQRQSDEAIELTDQLLHRVANGELRSDALTTTTLALLAEAVHLLPERTDDLATVLANEISPLVHMHTVVNAFGAGSLYWGSLHHAHGLALHAAGERAEGIAAVERAVNEHRRTSSAPYLRRSEAALARLKDGHG